MSRSQCRNCGASRGVATYTDKTYCFSCKEILNNKSLIKSSRPTNNLKDLTINEISLKYNHVQYLEMYGINNAEVFNIKYSKRYDRISFPIYKEKTVIGYWMRSLTETPKWLYIGAKQDLFVVQSGRIQVDHKECIYRPKKVVIVEDIVSAFKISFLYDAICLGGTQLKSKLLFKNYKDVYLWLDGDRAGRTASEEIRRDLKLFCDVKEIRTNKDPKCYNTKEINGLLQ